MESPLDEEYGIPDTGSAPVDEARKAQPKSKGLRDRFVSLEVQQITLNSAYKQEERREVCRKIANWWKRFGRDTPELTKFAIRVLGLALHLGEKGIGAHLSRFIQRKEIDLNIKSSML
ncbi:hypothetical protein L3X38_026970 [Prunus dulcis]|uniref:Uncharacterized protein n=1 Tax=Prunus dulcis TaxID=3755 RepID=A0AAD4VNI0_PRUDU|nr:hypothetical protein L3X38_026970 [Prunus dulcis]